MTTTNHNTAAAEQRMEAEFQATLTGAVEACLWSTHPTPADEDMTALEYADEYFVPHREMDKLRGTLAYYMRGWFVENYGTICQALGDNYTWEHAGHDFWLTSQGHGAGFWDRGLGEVGDILTDSADGYSDMVGLYLDEEGVQVLVDSYNVNDFSTDLFQDND